MNTLGFKDKFAANTIGPNGIRMQLIGGFMELTAYYAGNDGNAWAFSTQWSNRGDLNTFVDNFSKRYRGILI